MRKLTYQELISPFPILIPNVGYLKHPTLGDVFSLGTNEFSQSKYSGLFNILCLTVPYYFEILGKEDFYEAFSAEEKQELNIFDIIILSKEMIATVLESLSFFIDGKITFSEDCFIVETNMGNGVINRDNFDDVCDAIKQINYISNDNKIPKGKPKNKIAAEILAKLNKANNVKKNQKEDDDLTLANMISALCVQHNSYNMTNVWSMTVYQLYDQFFRQNLKTQVDVSATRWAAWGKDPFDFNLWFKSIKNK